MRRTIMRPWRVAGLLFAVLALVTVVLVAWPQSKSAPSAMRDPASAAKAKSQGPVKFRYKPNPLLPNPKHRMLLGAYTYVAGESTEAAVQQREAVMGRHYDLELTYYNWKDPFPDQNEASIVAHGRIPVMTWYGPGRSVHSNFKLGEINDGQENAWILRQARAIKSFGKTIFLRPMIEMNGHWYRGYSGHPAAFIAAWRHIYDLFAQAGVHNVIWVWCPNLGPHNWDRYYPGNAYVDVIGVDGFNGWGYWRSFKQMFQPFLEHFAGRKPLMIGETGTDNLYGLAGTWINGMHSYLKNVAGPRYGVVAVCYFDNKVGSPYDWSLDQTPAAWKAWLSLARDPYFGGHGSPAGG